MSKHVIEDFETTFAVQVYCKLIKSFLYKLTQSGCLEAPSRVLLSLHDCASYIILYIGAGQLLVGHGKYCGRFVNL